MPAIGMEEIACFFPCFFFFFSSLKRALDNHMFIWSQKWVLATRESQGDF
jgi:hypothetical protein